MVQDPRPLFLAGRPSLEGDPLDVLDKATGEILATVTMAGPRTIDRAITAAVEAAPAMAALPAHARRDILTHCVDAIDARSAELADTLCAEAGKPIRDARGEVERMRDTFRVAAEEATRLGGERLEMEIAPRAEGYSGTTRRFPVGPCSFITPFNFPLNLVAHKVAPAIAAGCPFVLKPASLTPLSALALGEILAGAGLPPGAFSILPAPRDAADAFTEDPRLKLLSFTGSPEVGWALKERAGKKRVVLELGGNAAVVVEPDWDLEDAVERIVVGTFAQSGQSCISVQRILGHRAIYDALRDALVARARELVVGDPRDEATVVGPMISEKEAERLHGWIHDAVDAGATLLCGGGRTGATLQPTLLEGVPRDLPVCAAEAFGPVAVLEPYDRYTDALDRVNDTRFGLQAGVFTRDLGRANAAWERLEVGGVVVGDVPAWRIDHMPYGGVKESGIGREGVRWAMEDMTDVRLLIVRDPGINDG